MAQNDNDVAPVTVPVMAELVGVAGQECFVCATHAVVRGVSFNEGDDGVQLADGTTMHPPVTALGGTPVCWYHITHVHGGGLSETGWNGVQELQAEVKNIDGR